MTFQKISSPTLKELFIEQIEDMILSNELKIGQKLPSEREMAQMMQVSRSVVNDGIVEMARKGFLKIIPRQGTYVADYKKEGTIDILFSIMKNRHVSNDYIQSILQLRIYLMNLTLESSIENITQKDLQQLEAISLSLKNSSTMQEAALCLYEFDHYLTTLSANLLLPLIVTSFKNPNMILFERYLQKYGTTKMYERNLVLLQCLERKDLNKAKKIMQTSIENTLNGQTQIFFDEIKK